MGFVRAYVWGPVGAVLGGVLGFLVIAAALFYAFSGGDVRESAKATAAVGKVGGEIVTVAVMALDDVADGIMGAKDQIAPSDGAGKAS